MVVLVRWNAREANIVSPKAYFKSQETVYRNHQLENTLNIIVELGLGGFMLTHRVGLSGTAALLAVLLTSCAPRVTQHPSAPTAQQSTTSLVYISDTSGINVRPSFTLQYTTIVQFPLFNTYAPPIAVDPSGNLWSLGLQNKFVYEYRPPNYSGLSYPVDMVPYFLAFRPRTSHLWLIGSKHGLLTLEELRTRDQLYTLPVLRAFDVRINVSSSLPSNVSVKGLLSIRREMFGYPLNIPTRGLAPQS